MLSLIIGKFSQILGYFRLPVYDEEIELTYKIDSKIKIIRDNYGTPHIYAKTERDLLFGQGFVHAQERLYVTRCYLTLMKMANGNFEKSCQRSTC